MGPMCEIKHSLDFDDRRVTSTIESQ